MYVNSNYELDRPQNPWNWSIINLFSLLFFVSCNLLMGCENHRLRLPGSNICFEQANGQRLHVKIPKIYIITNRQAFSRTVREQYVFFCLENNLPVVPPLLWLAFEAHIKFKCLNVSIRHNEIVFFLCSGKSQQGPREGNWWVRIWSRASSRQWRTIWSKRDGRLLVQWELEKCAFIGRRARRYGLGEPYLTVWQPARGCCQC